MTCPALWVDLLCIGLVFLHVVWGRKYMHGDH